jgi:hypothetical protein
MSRENSSPDLAARFFLAASPAHLGTSFSTEQFVKLSSRVRGQQHVSSV